MLYYQGLLYIPKIICLKLISRYHNDSLVGYFEIEKNLRVNNQKFDVMHPLKKTQIAHLKADQALIEVSNKYVDFADVFSLKLTSNLFKYMRINNHKIELVDDW